jgi:hypothetical protein
VRCNLTPEEDAIGDPGDEDDEIDDTLPADLWFQHRCGLALGAALSCVCSDSGSRKTSPTGTRTAPPTMGS